MNASIRESALFSRVTESAPDLVGVWVNELGSRMVIVDVSGDNFSGFYFSKVSDDDKPAKGMLSGTIAGDTLGFIVNWKPTYHSVTSWSGKLLASAAGAPSIYTLWQLSRGVADSDDWWQSFLAGSDRFELETRNFESRSDLDLS